MVNPCTVAADVGCDHGFLSIYLIENEIAGRVYACDINSGPIERAAEHIAEHRLEDRISTIQCDGLSGIDYADAIVIAGMGGRLMIRILTEGMAVLKKADQLILEPQSELLYFRKSLCELGLLIDKEDFVLDEGKYYPIIHAVKGEMKLDEVSAAYGPCLLRDKNQTLKDFLLKEKEYKLNVLKTISENEDVSEKTGLRIKELKEELALNTRALGELI